MSRLDKEEIEKRLRKLEQENQEIKRKNRKLEHVVDRLTQTGSKNITDEQFSRRSFLKKIGAGAVGLSAVGLASASGMKLTKNGINHSGSSVLDFSASNSLNSDLDLQNSYSINNASSISANKAVVDNIALSKNTIGNISKHEGDSVSVASNSWQTVFDFSNAVDCLGGVIINNASVLFDIRITWEDDTTDTIRAMARSNDKSGSKYTDFPVPPITDVKKLEFYNGGANSQQFGWGVMTI